LSSAANDLKGTSFSFSRKAVFSPQWVYTKKLEWLSETDERLAMLSRLPDDWDGEGSAAVSRQALAVVSGLVDRIKAHRPKLADPFIAPLSDGGLQMEWRSYASATLVLVIPSEAAQIEYLLDVQESTGVVESEGIVGVTMALEHAIDRLR
jgi:hypothetical protein